MQRIKILLPDIEDRKVIIKHQNIEFMIQHIVRVQLTVEGRLDFSNLINFNLKGYMPQLSHLEGMLKITARCTKSLTLNNTNNNVDSEQESLKGRTPSNNNKSLPIYSVEGLSKLIPTATNDNYRTEKANF